MKFLGIFARDRALRQVEAKTVQRALPLVGLHPHRTDHGVVFRSGVGVSIVVYEWSLMRPPAQQQYYSLAHRLYCGNALLYAFDAMGVTLDMPANVLINPRWFNSIAEIETEIGQGRLPRPANQALGWTWPQPPPAMARASMEEHGEKL